MRRVVAIIVAVAIVVSLNAVFAAEGDVIKAEEEESRGSQREVVGSVKFTDIPDDAYYAKAVYTLTYKGVISGYADGTFRPNEQIKRDQFLKMVISAIGIEVDAPPAGYPWFSNYAKVALKMGLMGFDEAWGAAVSRLSVAKAIVNSQPDEKYPDNYIMYQTLIRDFDKVPMQYREYILKAFVSGIISTDTNGNINSNVYITRAEAAVYVYRMIDKSARKIPTLPNQSGKEEFIVPDLRVVYYDTPGYPFYFRIEVANNDLYKGKNYVATVECLNHPELNTREIVWGNKWDTLKGIRYPLGDRDNDIHSQFHVWRLDRGGWIFEYIPGMKLIFKVNVTNGKETRSYYVTGNIYERTVYWQ